MAAIAKAATRTYLPREPSAHKCPFCRGPAGNWLGATDNGVRGSSPTARLATSHHCREQTRYFYRVTNGTQKARNRAYKNRLRRAYGERLAGVMAD